MPATFRLWTTLARIPSAQMLRESIGGACLLEDPSARFFPGLETRVSFHPAKRCASGRIERRTGRRRCGVLLLPSRKLCGARALRMEYFLLFQNPSTSDGVFRLG